MSYLSLVGDSGALMKKIFFVVAAISWSTTKSGQHTLSFLLSAHAAGRNVTISGHGVCSNWSRSESFRYGLYAF